MYFLIILQCKSYGAEIFHTKESINKARSQKQINDYSLKIIVETFIIIIPNKCYPQGLTKILRENILAPNWKRDIIRKTGNDYCKMTQEAFFQQNIAHEGSCGN